jgi:hypothetical protein
MPGHHRFDVLQTLREALPCGSAEDMRLAEPGSVAADGGCPEADFMSRVRFNFKALAHVSAAFCAVWKGCGTSTRTRLHALLSPVQALRRQDPPPPSQRCCSSDDVQYALAGCAS